MVTRNSIGAVLAAALLFAATLAGCNAEKDEFNPIRLLCPGDFDPVTNKCKIETPSP